MLVRVRNCSLSGAVEARLGDRGFGRLQSSRVGLQQCVGKLGFDIRLNSNPLPIRVGDWIHCSTGRDERFEPRAQSVGLQLRDSPRPLLRVQ